MLVADCATATDATAAKMSALNCILNWKLTKDRELITRWPRSWQRNGRMKHKDRDGQDEVEMQESCLEISRIPRHVGVQDGDSHSRTWCRWMKT